jgi:hypothetical protein
VPLSVADFRAEFPEFADTFAFSTDLIQRKLDQAERRISWDYLGDRADDAQGYLAAHLLLMSTNASLGMGVQSVTGGPISVSYAGASADGSGYGATGYGREFLALVQLAGPGASVLE